MWYLPAVSAFTVYSPAAPVWAVTVRPVAALVTATAAFGMTAPLGSVIVPMRRAVSDCARARPVRQNTKIRARENLLFTIPPIARMYSRASTGTSGVLWKLHTYTTAYKNLHVLEQSER